MKLWGCRYGKQPKLDNASARGVTEDKCVEASKAILRVGHFKRNANRDGNLSAGSNQSDSAYENLARMDEGLGVEADGLDDDGDDTDSDESRSVSSQLSLRS